MLSYNCAADLRPGHTYEKVSDISPAALRGMGASAVALDIDNTLAYDGTYRLFEDVPGWIESLREAQIGIVILTNTYRLRAKRIARKLGVPYVSGIKKPDPAGFFAAADICGVAPGNMAMIGDQLFTDIRGANNAGCIPVLVRYRRREFWFGLRFRLLRARERACLKRLGCLPPWDADRKKESI